MPLLEEHFRLFYDGTTKDAAEKDNRTEEADVQKTYRELAWDLASTTQPVDDRDQQISEDSSDDKRRKDFPDDVEKPDAADYC